MKIDSKDVRTFVIFVVTLLGIEGLRVLLFSKNKVPESSKPRVMIRAEVENNDTDVLLTLIQHTDDGKILKDMRARITPDEAKWLGQELIRRANRILAQTQGLQLL